ncbi:glycosyltransferase family 4 protein [Methylacidiphilum kamchatkense]|uniref:glycosyltransferase family 4 protein n=1 Tax=Methylacidiphilum kamchatkense TaxID=431057 RepID=UPI001F304A01|nr:glycosyltransferase family 4 protein [Methylacidiphilum kamchatkense]
MYNQTHSITLLTSVDCDEKNPFPYQVIRKIDPFTVFYATAHADVILHNHLSIKLCWASALLNKPYGVIIQNWLSFKGIKGLLYKWILKKAKIVIGVSKAITDHLPYGGIVIPNAYDHRIFCLPLAEDRPKDLLFVGRMELDKGAQNLLKAIILLKQENINLTATFVGYGPDENNLKILQKEYHLENEVSILGPKNAQEVASLMQKHKILVVPSRKEPFGIVALEGIACGCVVIGTEEGGLKEAIGPCGLTYPNGDINQLTYKIKELLGNPKKMYTLKSNAKEHLKKYTSEAIGKLYNDLLSTILSKE